MIVLILTVFVSLLLVVAGLVFFVSRLREGDFDHGDRLSLLPLDEEPCAGSRAAGNGTTAVGGSTTVARGTTAAGGSTTVASNTDAASATTDAATASDHTAPVEHEER